MDFTIILFAIGALVLCGILLSLVTLVLVIRGRGATGNSSDLASRIDESSRANQQAVQLISNQLNQRVSEQSDSLSGRLLEQSDSISKRLGEQSDSLSGRLGDQTKALNDRISEQTKALNDRISEQSLTVGNELARNREELSRELLQIRQTMEQRLASIQEENTKKLDEMRVTVDEKLSETLERRFAESFTLISDRLESVQRGLGEMQSLAGSVVDLKNVLTNVKTRGSFGEYQLQALLEDVLAPDQYEVNFAPNPRSQQRVEFAVRLPGGDEPVYLPVDSKFPIENYQRLLEAYDSGDRDEIASAYKILLNQARTSAREIRDKYLNPPRTTDFAVMFVPTEGLYAELLREPGFADDLRGLKVVLAGPTTFYALVSTFQVGFTTLAIEKRTGEIETLLGAVKSEFGKFAGILEKVDKRLEQARQEIGNATRKTTTIQRRLRSITELPLDQSILLLEPGGVDSDDAIVILDEYEALDDEGEALVDDEAMGLDDDDGDGGGAGGG